jgi:hypothetical protein
LRHSSHMLRFNSFPAAAESAARVFATPSCDWVVRGPHTSEGHECRGSMTCALRGPLVPHRSQRRTRTWHDSGAGILLVGPLLKTGLTGGYLRRMRRADPQTFRAGSPRAVDSRVERSRAPLDYTAPNW